MKGAVEECLIPPTLLFMGSGASFDVRYCCNCYSSHLPNTSECLSVLLAASGILLFQYCLVPLLYSFLYSCDAGRLVSRYIRYLPAIFCHSEPTRQYSIAYRIVDTRRTLRGVRRACARRHRTLPRVNSSSACSFQF